MWECWKIRHFPNSLVRALHSMPRFLAFWLCYLICFKQKGVYSRFQNTWQYYNTTLIAIDAWLVITMRVTLLLKDHRKFVPNCCYYFSGLPKQHSFRFALLPIFDIQWYVYLWGKFLYSCCTVVIRNNKECFKMFATIILFL